MPDVRSVSKTCPKCKTEKPLSEFYCYKKTGRLKSWCRKCSNESSLRWRERNPEKVSTCKQRHYKENKKRLLAFGKRWRKENPIKVRLIVSKSEAKRLGHAACTGTVAELKAAQTGLCHICGVPETECTKGLCIDHCHKTGEFRGWLCVRCNSAISLLGDCPERLLMAAKYLEPRSLRNWLFSAMIE